MPKSEKISIGSVVEFKSLERVAGRPNIAWIDEFDNKIPPGTKGLIIGGKYFQSLPILRLVLVLMVLEKHMIGFVLGILKIRLIISKNMNQN